MSAIMEGAHKKLSTWSISITDSVSNAIIPYKGLKIHRAKGS